MFSDFTNKAKSVEERFANRKIPSLSVSILQPSLAQCMNYIFLLFYLTLRKQGVIF